jgi:hypothetical protein
MVPMGRVGRTKPALPRESNITGLAHDAQRYTDEF